MSQVTIHQGTEPAFELTPAGLAYLAEPSRRTGFASAKATIDAIVRAAAVACGLPAHCAPSALGLLGGVAGLVLFLIAAASPFVVIALTRGVR